MSKVPQVSAIAVTASLLIMGCLTERAVAVKPSPCDEEPCPESSGNDGGALDPDAIPAFTLVVDAPERGATVSGRVAVRGRAPGFVNVEVWDATHTHPALSQADVAADGRFSMTVDAGLLLPGPTRWTVHAWDVPPGEAYTRMASASLELTIDAPSDAGPCGGETCSGEGTCSVVDGVATCTCSAGFVASGLSCVPVAPDLCPERSGAAGHVAPTCVRKALIGGGHMDLQAWAAALGRPTLDIQMQWDNVLEADPTNDAAADWNWIENHYSTAQWIVQAGWDGAVGLGMPMWVRGQDPYVCVSGQNDADMTAAIASLYDLVGDDRDVYIRLGWEFNADWYPTQTSEGDAVYRQAWRDCWIRWYDTIKAVSPKYMVVWNPNWANNGGCMSGFTSVVDLWPGAEFVDAAGPDQYDATWCGGPAAYDEWDGDQPVGIGAWADWVIAQGVPFAVPEWGVDSGQWGNGDRPEFIRDMYAAFAKAHAAESGLAFQSYFDGGADYDCRFSLLDPSCDRNPRSSAEYFSLFWTWPPK